MSEYCKNCKELADENGSLKRQLDDASKALQDYNTLPCYDVAFDRGAMAAKKKYLSEIESLKAKLADLERQIKDGELVPVALIYDIVGDFHSPNNSWRHLESYAKMRAQQYAASKQKEGGE